MRIDNRLLMYVFIIVLLGVVVLLITTNILPKEEDDPRIRITRELYTNKKKYQTAIQVIEAEAKRRSNVYTDIYGNPENKTNFEGFDVFLLPYKYRELSSKGKVYYFVRNNKTYIIFLDKKSNILHKLGLYYSPDGYSFLLDYDKKRQEQKAKGIAVEETELNCKIIEDRWYYVSF